MSTHNMFSLRNKKRIPNFGQVNFGWTSGFDHLLVHVQVIKFDISTTLHKKWYTRAK